MFNLNFSKIVFLLVVFVFSSTSIADGFSIEVQPFNLGVILAPSPNYNKKDLRPPFPPTSLRASQSIRCSEAYSKKAGWSDSGLLPTLFESVLATIYTGGTNKVSLAYKLDQAEVLYYDNNSGRLDFRFSNPFTIESVHSGSYEHVHCKYKIMAIITDHDERFRPIIHIVDHSISVPSDQHTDVSSEVFAHIEDFLGPKNYIIEEDQAY